MPHGLRLIKVEGPLLLSMTGKAWDCKSQKTTGMNFPLKTSCNLILK